MGAVTRTVDVNVVLIHHLDKVPVLVASGISPGLEPEDMRDIAEQLREQIGPEFRVVVVDGLTLEPAHADMALSLLRVLEEAWTNDTVEAFGEQWAVIRQYLAALDAPEAPPGVTP
jgi:hypothetical protein